MALTDESVLTSVKKVLGLDEAYTAFDPDIIMHINSAFSELFQLGAGPQTTQFFIEDDTKLWTEFFGVESHNILMAKTFVCQYVRLRFDPPGNSFGIESINKQLEEAKWRISVAVDRGQMEMTHE